MAHVQGKQLPLIVHEDAVELDVWRSGEGVGITLSNAQGRIYAGCAITRLQWKTVVEYISKQLGDADA